MKFIVSDGDGFEDWGVCTLERQKFLPDGSVALVRFDIRYVSFLPAAALCVFLSSAKLEAGLAADFNCKSCFGFDNHAQAEALFAGMTSAETPMPAGESFWFGFRNAD